MQCGLSWHCSFCDLGLRDGVRAIGTTSAVSTRRGLRVSRRCAVFCRACSHSKRKWMSTWLSASAHEEEYVGVVQSAGELYFTFEVTERLWREVLLEELLHCHRQATALTQPHASKASSSNLLLVNDLIGADVCTRVRSVPPGQLRARSERLRSRASAPRDSSSRGQE